MVQRSSCLKINVVAHDRTATHHMIPSPTRTTRVKPWLIQSSMDRTKKCDHSLEIKMLSRTLMWCCWFVNFTQFVMLENLSILDLALSGVKGLNIYAINQTLAFLLDLRIAQKADYTS